MKTHEVVVYKQGDSWILSDRETETLPYYLETKKDVRDYLERRAEERGIEIKITWED